MPWWKENRMRLAQFNLMETDAGADPGELVRWLKSMHANALMTGAGGIVSYYPSRLPFVYASPAMGGHDMLGELVSACHAEGIRVIARFDFSKVHESVANAHPEWLYRDAKGRSVLFNGTVHTCLSGEYQWNLSLDIIKECLTRYPVDGVYINMFGFQTIDYAGIDHGVCQCESCRRRYREASGQELPKGVGQVLPQSYLDYRQTMADAMLERVYKLIKSINPEISVCTHSQSPYVDMVHTESNYALHREPKPFWLYASSDQCRMINDSYTDTSSANCVINAADIAWRFMGVADGLNRARLWQNIAAGSQPEWCIVGLPGGYPDQANFEGVRRVFAFHERNEQYLGQRRSLADIVLVHPEQIRFCTNTGEYMGIFKALKEGHYNFDVVFESRIGEVKNRYRIAIVPGISVDPALLGDQTSVLATGDAYHDDPAALNDLFGGVYDHTAQENAGAYLLAGDGFKRLPKTRWVLLDGAFHCIRFRQGQLPYMAPARYGPVETAGGTEPGTFHAAGILREEGRTNVLLPWALGTLYENYGFEAHRNLLLDLLDEIGGAPVETDAPPMVELFYDGCPGGRLIQMVNLTGFNGTSFHEPIPVYNAQVAVPADGDREALDLVTGEALPCAQDGEMLRITLPALHDYAAILIPGRSTAAIRPASVCGTQKL